jgi:lysophospholipase L1-like esterase
MTNGLVFPYTNVVSTTNVRDYQKLRIVPSVGAATYSNIEVTYANFVILNGGESAAYQPVTIQSEILYKGIYYPVLFNGQSTATVTGGDHVTGTAVGLSVQSGDQFFERVRVVGAVGSQRYLVSHGSRRVLSEGVLAGTNASVNLFGGKEGHGATCSFVISAGKIVSAKVDNPGSNYTAAGVVAAFDPATQTDNTVGYSNQSGGRMTSIVVTTPGVGYPTGTKCVIVGGGGFGQNGAIYAASLITGVPNVDGLKSILIVGDSIARGYGSTDGVGDASGNYGIFERAVGNRYATVSTALPGNTATAYKNPASHARMYSIILPYVTHAFVQLGTNDIVSNAYSATSVANANITSATELRSAGIKVSFTTLIPRDEGEFDTLADQSPASGFAPGGIADTYNGWVRAGTNGLASEWGMIDPRAVYQDTAEPSKWRVDSIMTNDGIHPNVTAGIPFGAAQLTDRFNALP